MKSEWLLPILVLMPVLLAGVALVLRTARSLVRFCAAGTLAVAALAAVVTWRVFHAGSLLAAGDWFMLDALSAYHIVVMMIVFSFSSLYALAYFREEIEHGAFSVGMARRYGGLWFGSLAAMMLVLVSNNLGIMWVGIEASTLLTAFLICIHVSPGALEAMWKYLVMCSVGVAVAFTGILLIASSTGPTAVHGAEALLWTNLRDTARELNPLLLKAGFIFLVVGYGTKAGLAPMHNWLPDAHSQAPAPVSAVFSGFLLNAALYCILRCLPIVETATGHVGWGGDVLIVLGLASLLVAAIFIVAQRDLKRFLAYSSVEHIGLIALGVGLGGLGAVAALFHMLGHSVGKSVAFASAGRLGQFYGTHNMERMSGILRRSPLWGGGLTVALLALVGMAPFSLFLSEFMMIKAAVDQGAWWVTGLLLAGLTAVFIGIWIQAIALAWKALPEGGAKPRVRAWENLLVLVPLALLLVLGVWLPSPLRTVLTRAAEILGGAS